MLGGGPRQRMETADGDSGWRQRMVTADMMPCSLTGGGRTWSRSTLSMISWSCSCFAFS